MARRQDKVLQLNQQHSSRCFQPLGKLVASVLGLSFLALSACGVQNSMNKPFEISAEYKAFQESEAEQKELVSPISPRFRNRNSSINSLVSSKLYVDMENRVVYATVTMNSSDGLIPVEMGGRMGLDGSATLVELNPIAENHQRLAATFYCGDKDACRKTILNVYYKVGRKTIRQQFVSSAMIEAAKAKVDQSNDHNHTDERTESGTEPDHGKQDPNNPDNELVGEEQSGEFVGVPLDNESIEKLVPFSPSEVSVEEPNEDHTPVEIPTAPQQPGDNTKPDSGKPATQEPGSKTPNSSQLLNLIEGGQAVGWHTKGKILNATPLPNSGPAFRKVYTNRETHWGSGLMVSFIQNASEVFRKKWYPDTIVMVGDISKKNGGDLGTHASHQSGLDVDIPYIGNDGFVSVLAKNGVNNKFDYSKNWQFFRLTASQRVTDSGREVTVLNRIFVNPTIKKSLCTWAKQTKLLENPFDADIMRRIRPTSGHHKHFHLRLKCSPHYPECRNQVEPPSGTGC